MLSETQNKPSILYSCPLDLVQREAPAYHVVNVVKELRNLGYPIELIHQGDSRSDLQGIKQIALGLDRHSKLGRLKSDFGYILGLHKRLRSRRYQWVYHRLEKWSVLPLILFRFYGLPVVLEFNSDVDAELRSLGKGRLFRKLYSYSERLQVRLADRIVTVSKGIEYNLVKNHASISGKISTIENGTDVEIFHPKDRMEACRKLKLDPSRIYVTFAGSIQQWQGIETIIDCAPIVLNQLPKVQFLIIGDGSQAKHIESLIKSKNLDADVLMPGWQPSVQLADYLAASDICLAPYSRKAALQDQPQTDNKADYSNTLMKCSPLKIFTYMAMGKPVIASDFSDGGNRLAKWNTGLSHDPNDAGELATAILKLLSNPELAKSLGNNGHERVLKFHTWKSVAEEIERFCFIGS